jgi:hypothetical protein
MATIKIQVFICVIIEIMLAQAIPDGPHTEVGAFVYVETLLGWNDAQSYCMNLFGTSLATVTTNADIDLLVSSCDPLKGTPNSNSCPARLRPGGNENNCGCWIGLFREDGTAGEEDGPWEWADGCTEYDFRNWATGPAPAQPDNRHDDEECVSLFRDFDAQTDGTWADRPCDGISGGVASQYFFCNSPGLCTDFPTTNPSPSPTIVSISPTNSPTGSSDSSEDCCPCLGSQSNKHSVDGDDDDDDMYAAVALSDGENNIENDENTLVEHVVIKFSKSASMNIFGIICVFILGCGVIAYCFCVRNQKKGKAEFVDIV